MEELIEYKLNILMKISISLPIFIFLGFFLNIKFPVRLGLYSRINKNAAKSTLELIELNPLCIEISLEP